MKRSKTVPDKFTFPSLVKGCSNEFALREGTTIHASIVRYGTETDVFVGTSLIDFYGKCREVGAARKIFDSMCKRNEVTWTAMLVSYASLGVLSEAKKLFDEMPKKNLATWNAMINGYIKFGDLIGARNLFDQMPEKNVVSFTSMIDGYAKVGDMASAMFLFERSPDKDVVLWSALISGYTQNGRPDEAINLFIKMGSHNIKPDEFIMVSLMSSCSQVGDLELAKWVESYVSSCSIDLSQPHVVAALIDMNAKCGRLERAMELFEQMPRRDLVSYSSIMQGLSMHGRGAQAVSIFKRMITEGLTPDNVALTVILTACSRAGLVEEGIHYFDSMINEYCLVPLPDHFACMVDLLARCGRLKAAYEMIKSMPMETHAGAWGALLGACKLHCDTELGEVVASRLFELEPQSGGSYVLLSDIYAAADRWLDVALVRDKMKERGIRKIPGCSWV